jgi:hypothetical protein
LHEEGGYLYSRADADKSDAKIGTQVKDIRIRLEYIPNTIVHVLA